MNDLRSQLDAIQLEVKQNSRLCSQILQTLKLMESKPSSRDPSTPASELTMSAGSTPASGLTSCGTSTPSYITPQTPFAFNSGSSIPSCGTNSSMETATPFAYLPHQRFSDSTNPLLSHVRTPLQDASTNTYPAKTPGAEGVELDMDEIEACEAAAVKNTHAHVDTPFPPLPSQRQKVLGAGASDRLGKLVSPTDILNKQAAAKKFSIPPGKPLRVVMSKEDRSALPPKRTSLPPQRAPPLPVVPAPVDAPPTAPLPSKLPRRAVGVVDSADVHRRKLAKKLQVESAEELRRQFLAPQMHTLTPPSAASTSNNARVAVSAGVPVAEKEKERKKENEAEQEVLVSEPEPELAAGPTTATESTTTVTASRPSKLQRSPPAVFVSPKVLRSKREPPVSKQALLKPSAPHLLTATTSATAAASRTNAAMQSLSQLQARGQGKVLQGGGKAALAEVPTVPAAPPSVASPPAKPSSPRSPRASSGVNSSGIALGGFGTGFGFGSGPTSPSPAPSLSASLRSPRSSPRASTSRLPLHHSPVYGRVPASATKDNGPPRMSSAAPAAGTSTSAHTTTTPLTSGSTSSSGSPAASTADYPTSQARLVLQSLQSPTAGSRQRRRSLSGAAEGVSSIHSMGGIGSVSGGDVVGGSEGGADNVGGVYGGVSHLPTPEYPPPPAPTPLSSPNSNTNYHPAYTFTTPYPDTGSDANTNTSTTATCGSDSGVVTPIAPTSPYANYHLDSYSKYASLMATPATVNRITTGENTNTNTNNDTNSNTDTYTNTDSYTDKYTGLDFTGAGGSPVPVGGGAYSSVGRTNDSEEEVVVEADGGTGTVTASALWGSADEQERYPAVPSPRSLPLPFPSASFDSTVPQDSGVAVDFGVSSGASGGGGDVGSAGGVSSASGESDAETSSGSSDGSADLDASDVYGDILNTNTTTSVYDTPYSPSAVGATTSHTYTTSTPTTPTATSYAHNYASTITTPPTATFSPTYYTPATHFGASPPTVPSTGNTTTTAGDSAAASPPYLDPFSPQLFSRGNSDVTVAGSSAGGTPLTNTHNTTYTSNTTNTAGSRAHHSAHPAPHTTSHTVTPPSTGSNTGPGAGGRYSSHQRGVTFAPAPTLLVSSTGTTDMQPNPTASRMPGLGSFSISTGGDGSGDGGDGTNNTNTSPGEAAFSVGVEPDTPLPAPSPFAGSAALASLVSPAVRSARNYKGTPRPRSRSTGSLGSSTGSMDSVGGSVGSGVSGGVGGSADSGDIRASGREETSPAAARTRFKKALPSGEGDEADDEKEVENEGVEVETAAGEGCGGVLPPVTEERRDGEGEKEVDEEEDTGLETSGEGAADDSVDLSQFWGANTDTSTTAVGDITDLFDVFTTATDTGSAYYRDILQQLLLQQELEQEQDLDQEVEEGEEEEREVDQDETGIEGEGEGEGEGEWENEEGQQSVPGYEELKEMFLAAAPPAINTITASTTTESAAPEPVPAAADGASPQMDSQVLPTADPVAGPRAADLISAHSPERRAAAIAAATTSSPKQRGGDEAEEELPRGNGRDDDEDARGAGGSGGGVGAGAGEGEGVDIGDWLDVQGRHSARKAKRAAAAAGAGSHKEKLA